VAGVEVASMARRCVTLALLPGRRIPGPLPRGRQQVRSPAERDSADRRREGAGFEQPVPGSFLEEDRDARRAAIAEYEVEPTVVVEISDRRR